MTSFNRTSPGQLKKDCEVCGKRFYFYPYRKGQAKYCSHDCYAKTVHLQPKTKKFYDVMTGRTPWNKGKKWNKEVREKLKIAQRRRWDEQLKRRKKVFGKEYANLHYWVRSNLGSASECVLCGENEKRCGWANISGDYKQDLSDYISLCQSCHYWYDRGDKKTEEKVKNVI